MYVGPREELKGVLNSTGPVVGGAAEMSMAHPKVAPGENRQSGL